MHHATLHPTLSGKKLDDFRAFLGINFDAIYTIKLGKKCRLELVQNLILYFEVHLHGFRKPRPLAIRRSFQLICTELRSLHCCYAVRYL